MERTRLFDRRGMQFLAGLALPVAILGIAALAGWNTASQNPEAWLSGIEVIFFPLLVVAFAFPLVAVASVVLAVLRPRVRTFALTLAVTCGLPSAWAPWVWLSLGSGA